MKKKKKKGKKASKYSESTYPLNGRLSGSKEPGQWVAFLVRERIVEARFGRSRGLSHKGV